MKGKKRAKAKSNPDLEAIRLLSFFFYILQDISTRVMDSAIAQRFSVSPKTVRDIRLSMKDPEVFKIMQKIQQSAVRELEEEWKKC